MRSTAPGSSRSAAGAPAPVGPAAESGPAARPMVARAVGRLLAFVGVIGWSCLAALVAVPLLAIAGVDLGSLAASTPLEAMLAERPALLVAILAAVAGLTLGWPALHRSRVGGGRTADGRVLAAMEAWSRGERDPEALVCAPEAAPAIAAWNRMVEQLLDPSRGPRDRRQDAAGPPVAGERRLGPMCNALPDGLILVGEDRRIRYANGAAAFLFGRSVEDLIGLVVDEVIPSSEVRAAIADAVGGVPRFAPPVDVARGEGAADGVLRHVVRPIRGDIGRDAVVLLQDVTQQHVAAASRESFVAHVAHELRTPLTNVMLWAQTATERGADDPRTTEKALNIITTESRRLERVVQDMLCISEIESGRQALNLTDVDLMAFVDELRHDYEPQAREKGLTLEFEVPPKLPTLTADRDKVGVAVHNLLGNAIKYTPTGGRVLVRINAGGGEGGGGGGAAGGSDVSVEVQDTGIGIGEADLAKIFERFQRAEDERIAGIAGSGLGLAIARDLARLHGGDIEAQSTRDEGSLFTLRLPVRAAA